MKILILALTIIFVGGVFIPYANAESIPDWIKNNAKWWAEDTISEEEFVSGIKFLIQEDILTVPQTSVSAEKSSEVPDWIKNNAKWWAEGTITDDDFIGGIQFMIQVEIISIVEDNQITERDPSQNSKMESLEVELEACKEIKTGYERIKCKDEVQLKIITLQYLNNGKAFEVGPITFYYPPAELEFASDGQANLNVKLLAVNTGSNENVALMCTGPSVCNYDIWDGQKAYKYASTNFTSGQIVLKPGDAREISIFFGPNIGYGGTEFEYDSSKDYSLRVSEPWGSTSIPLELD
jgi:hypothetical protein